MSELNLENTSQFSRPVWATDKDLKIGEDELGNPRYRGQGGREYTVSPSQPNSMRPEGGYVRAALGAVKDMPPVADWDFEKLGPEMAKGARAVAEALWGVVQTPGQILSGEKSPTIGDAVDVAGFSATGGLSASAAGLIPEDAIGMFLGPKAVSANLEKLEEAKRLFAEGKLGSTDIAEKTGWRNFRGDWMFEVSDSAFEVHPELKRAVRAQKRPLGSTVDVATKGGRFIGEYSEVDRTNFLVGGTPSPFGDDFLGPRTLGSYQHDALGGPKIKQHIEAPDSVALHEIQHAIQRQEGWSKGFNSERAYHDFAATYENLPHLGKFYLQRVSLFENLKKDIEEGLPGIKELFPDYSDQEAVEMLDGTLKMMDELSVELTEIEDQLGQLAPALGDLYSVTKSASPTENSSFDMYQRNAGEWLARKVEVRQNLMSSWEAPWGYSGPRITKDPFEDMPADLWDERDWKKILSRVDDAIRSHRGQDTLYSHMENRTR